MPEPFKNKFNEQLVIDVGHHLQRVAPAFPRDEFVAMACRGLEDLELKARSLHISKALANYLPKDFEKAARLLRECLHPDEEAPLQEMILDGRGLRGWAILPVADYVASHGLSHFDTGMALLRELTKRFTAEFAVRAFIARDPQRAFGFLREWANDTNFHVRRLASEGARPRLPWGQRLPSLMADPAPLIPLLNELKDDASDYVRRSVANNLNDIAKDHPDLVVALMSEWMQGADKKRQRLIQQACRSLVKAGHQPALQLFGCKEAQVEVTEWRLSADRIRLGESVQLQLKVQSLSRSEQTLVIDYAMHFRRANGTFSEKVFKWKRLVLAGGASVSLTKNHSFKTVTTRRYYPGEQSVAVQINGRQLATVSFGLDSP